MGVYALLLVVLFTSTISTTKAAEVEGAPLFYEEVGPPPVEEPLTYEEEIIKGLEDLVTPAEEDEFTEKVPKISAFFLKHSEKIAISGDVQKAIKTGLEKGAFPEFLVALDSNFETWGLHRGESFAAAVWAGIASKSGALKWWLKKYGDAESQLLYLELLGKLAKDVRTARKILTKLKDKKPEIFDRSTYVGRTLHGFYKEWVKDYKSFPLEALMEHTRDLEKEIREAKRRFKGTWKQHLGKT